MNEDRLWEEIDNLPSPEELFRIDENKSEAVSANGQKPIPCYKEVKERSYIVWISLLLLVLILSNLEWFGLHVYCMVSDSMESRLPKNSLVLVKKVDTEKLKTGDIITFINGEGLCVTHQIADIQGDKEQGEELLFLTKGTENRNIDKEAIKSSQIVGRTVFYIPYIGKLMYNWNPARWSQE